MGSIQLSAIVLVVGVVAYYWYRHKKQKPRLTDVALEKAIEKTHEHDEKKAAVDGPA